MSNQENSSHSQQQQKEADAYVSNFSSEAGIEANGNSISDYNVIKAIGKGKFSVVYRAIHKESERVVALKRIAIVDITDDRQRLKTLKEVRLLQRLDHPNIIKYLDAFIDEHDLVIVFEWAEAGDLKRQLRKATEKKVRFDERLVWRYFAQICEAIQYMHSARVMHRDLKPANIFLTSKGEVKVGDLGLSRALSENTMQAHSKVGTPLYMSPEVLRGKGYAFKSDVWSLGCILYELAVLRSPFKEEGLSLYGLFQKINAGKYPDVPQPYSEELRGMVRKMLDVDVSKRASIEEVCELARMMKIKTDKQRQERRARQAEAAAKKAAGQRSAEAEQQADREGKTTSSSPSTPKRGVAEANEVEGKTQLRSSRKKPKKSTKDYVGAGMSESVARSEREAGSASGSSSSSQQRAICVLLMEEILEKLKILQLDAEHKYTRVHFAVDMSTAGIVGGKKYSRHSQFLDFVALFVALLKMLGHTPADDLTSGMSSPSHVVRELLDSLVSVGFPSDAAGALSTQALTRGYGHEACTVLNWLLDQVMQQSNFRWKRPKYPEEGGEEEAEVDAAAEVYHDVAEKFQEDSGEEEIFYSETVNEEVYSKVADEDEDREKMESEIDPILWKTELERVRPKLTAPKVEGTKEWRSHLDLSRRHKEVVTQTLPDSKLMLARVAENVKNSLESIATREGYLNKSLAGVVADYKETLDKMVSLRSERDAKSQHLSCLTVDLQEVSDALEEVKHTMEERGSNMTDTSPLVKIKSSIKRLKEEIEEMGIRMGVLTHSLMQAKLRHRQRIEAAGGGTKAGELASKMEDDYDSNEDHW
eukprot:g7585.t1